MDKAAFAKVTIWCLLFFTVFAVMLPEFDLAVVAFALVLSSTLIWVCIVDAARLKIPNPAVFLIAMTGVCYILVIDQSLAIRRIIESFSILVLIYVALKITAILTAKPSFGFGDVKLVGACTLWVGIAGILTAMLVASAGGLVVAGLLWLFDKRKRGQPMAFGPFIALGVWAVWLSQVQNLT